MRPIRPSAGASETGSRGPADSAVLLASTVGMHVQIVKRGHAQIVNRVFTDGNP